MVWPLIGEGVALASRFLAKPAFNAAKNFGGRALEKLGINSVKDLATKEGAKTAATGLGRAAVERGPAISAGLTGASIANHMHDKDEPDTEATAQAASGDPGADTEVMAPVSPPGTETRQMPAVDGGYGRYAGAAGAAGLGAAASGYFNNMRSKIPGRIGDPARSAVSVDGNEKQVELNGFRTEADKPKGLKGLVMKIGPIIAGAAAGAALKLKTLENDGDSEFHDNVADKQGEGVADGMSRAGAMLKGALAGGLTVGAARSSYDGIQADGSGIRSSFAGAVANMAASTLNPSDDPDKKGMISAGLSGFSSSSMANFGHDMLTKMGMGKAADAVAGGGMAYGFGHTLGLTDDLGGKAKIAGLGAALGLADGTMNKAGKYVESPGADLTSGERAKSFVEKVWDGKDHTDEYRGEPGSQVQMGG